MKGLDVSNFGLIVFFVLAISLFLLSRGARRLLTFAQMSKSQRAVIERVWPVAEGLIWLFFLVSALPLVFDKSASFTPYVVASFIVGMVWFARAAIGDFIDGVFLRASQALKLGELVTVGSQTGTVRELGYRALTLETRDGAKVAIPYSRVSRDTITSLAHVEGVARHSFMVERPSRISAAAAHQVIVRVAMDCHWASTATEPRVEMDVAGGFEVTVFALDAERGPDIEAVVRRTLSVL